MSLRRLTKRIDDRGLQASLAKPRTIEFDLGAQYAFGTDCHLSDWRQFSNWSTEAYLYGKFFDPMAPGVPLDDPDADRLCFSSDILTETAENNEFEVVLTSSPGSKVAVVMFHHWFATERYALLGKFLASRGITFVEMSLPYHFGRSPVGEDLTERFVSPNVGLTIRSMRQGAVDGRKVVDWLKSTGYEKVFVSGVCLGSWVAGLVSANDANVDGASLWLAGGSPADVVWSGRSTEMIKDKIEPHLDYETLDKLWSVIDLNHHVLGLARKPLQIVRAKHDEIVRPHVTNKLLKNMEIFPSQPDVVTLNCGHASLSVPPFNIKAAIKLSSFVKRCSK